jgi:hypothetical protein
LTKQGVTLNLNNPLEMLKFKILMASPSLIAPNYEVRKMKQTYEFMVVDQGKIISKRVEQAAVKSKAYAKYAEITASTTKMKQFIKALGRTIPVNYTEDWLTDEVLTVLENSNHEFLAITNDPQFKDKVFMQEAVEAGAVRRLSDKRYTLDNGIELGDLQSAIKWVNNPDNQETKLRMKARIEMAARR